MGQVVPDRDTSVSRALATLSQANRVLVRATDEGTLLQQMCTTIADTGGYLLARPVAIPRRTTGVHPVDILLKPAGEAKK